MLTVIIGVGWSDLINNFITILSVNANDTGVAIVAIKLYEVGFVVVFTSSLNPLVVISVSVVPSNLYIEKFPRTIA